MEDPEVEHRGRIRRIERERLLVGVAGLFELARQAVGDPELVPVDRLARAQPGRLLERGHRLGQAAGAPVDHPERGMRPGELRM